MVWIDVKNSEQKIVTGDIKRNLSWKMKRYCSTIITVYRTVKNATTIASYPFNQVVVREHH